MLCWVLFVLFFIFYFWIIKNLLPKGKSPKKIKKNQEKAAKSHQKKRKTDSTSPKTEGKGHQPATRTWKTTSQSRNYSPQLGHKPTTLKKQTKNHHSKPSTRASTIYTRNNIPHPGIRKRHQQTTHIGDGTTNTSSSITSSGPQYSKRKASSLAQISSCRVVNNIMEACDPEFDIITNEIKNRINRNKLVLVNSCITLSPQMIYGSSPCNPFSDRA